MTVDVQVEPAATEEPPKTEGEAEKKEEEKPAEGEGGTYNNVTFLAII